MLPESDITFSELKEWYLDLQSVQRLSSYDRVVIAISNFVSVFGSHRVNSVKLTDIESYQVKREEDGRAPATIDMEIKIAQTMVNKAFDNDMIDGRVLKAFRKTKRKLKKNANARNRVLTIDEYLRLIDVSPIHLKALINIGFNTGMRAGEIRTLEWSNIDLKTGFIRLQASITKEEKPKTIPINHHVQSLLNSLPHAIHHDFVITYRGKPILQKDGFKRSFASACKKAEIPCGRKKLNGITIHDLRRTFKTNMLKAGIDRAIRDTILGHSLQGMDAYYLKPNENDLANAMDIFTAWLDSKLRITNENCSDNIEASKL